MIDDNKVGRRSKKPKGIKVPGSAAIYIQPVNAALLVVLQSIPAASTRKGMQDIDQVKKAIIYFCRL